jgi:hypothetical protein
MKYSLLATGLGLEAIAVSCALDGTSAVALAAHLGACGGIALGLGRRLPAGATGLVFAMTVFLPILGALGSIAVACVRPARSAPPRPALVRTPIPGPEAARVHAGRPVPPRGSLPSSARVLAARGRDDPGAIALLRRTLADCDEDVRLVAHAVLESKQRAAYRRLSDGARELDAAPPERRAMIERRMAAEHWELARTGLADGECLVHALESAREHARAAAAERPRSASLALLGARIALRCGTPAEAEAALARAVELGLPPAIAAPYLAEAAFAQHRFDRVPHRLAAAPPGNAAVDRIRRFWS